MTRLVFIIILLLISLLAIFKAPAYYLWLLAIGVTEFPWVFAGLTLIVLATGFWVSKYQLAGTVVGVLALLLFLSPIARAYIVSSSLKKNFDASFGLPDVKSDGTPFSFWQMFAGTPKIAYRSITYVTYPDTSLTLDYYPSQVVGKKPCVIVVHGGSWSSGDSQQLPELNSYLAVRGYNVASINYRMAPKYQNPAPVQDIQAALKFLTQHAAELHIDSTKFVLLGRSAGSQIALLAAYTLHDKQLKGVIDFYGPVDMVWGYSIPSNPLIMDSRKVMGDYIGGTYKQVPQKFAASSPIEFVDKQSPPTLIIHGHNDVLVAYEHSRRLNEKLNNNNIKHFWLKLPWATHGFDFNLNGPGGQLSTYSVLQFLNTITK
jgi:acetyl esterase/lipase